MVGLKSPYGGGFGGPSRSMPAAIRTTCAGLRVGVIYGLGVGGVKGRARKGFLRRGWVFDFRGGDPRGGARRGAPRPACGEREARQSGKPEFGAGEAASP